MTNEPRQLDDLRPADDDPLGGADALDQAFADVENEVGQAQRTTGATEAVADDDFADLPLDDADDVFVIEEDEDAFSAPASGTVAAAHEPEPEDLVDPTGLFAAASTSAASADDGSVEDNLFAMPSRDASGGERIGDDPPTFEDGGDEAGSERSWPGAGLSPDEMGIDARDGDDVARAVEEEADWSTADEEIEIVADDGDADVVGDFALMEGEPAEEFGIQPLDEVEVTAPASGVWDGGDTGFTRAGPRETTHPHAAGETEFEVAQDAEAEYAEAEDEAYDPIYGSDAMPDSEVGAQPLPVHAEADPDYSEYEESYVSHGAGVGTAMIGAPARRRRGAAALLAAAALALVGVAGGFAYMHPEWLGLESAPALVDRAVIARPTVAYDVGEPPPPSDAPVITAPDKPTDPPSGTADPVVPAADPTPPVQDPTETPPDPPTGGDPTGSTGPDVATGPDPRPAPTSSTNPDGPPGESAPADPRPATPPPADATPVAQTLRIGDDLMIRPADPLQRPRVHHLAEGLVTGSQAFAQLKNMNFFLGRVKAMDSSLLTLDLAPGEVTIAFDDLNAIVPLASEEYRLMHGAADGFVRLTNRNKLFGKILTSSLADNVVLEVHKSQVVIPRTSVEEVRQQGNTDVQVLDEADSDWIKTILQRQASKPAGKGGVSLPKPGGAAPPQDSR